LVIRDKERLGLALHKSYAPCAKGHGQGGYIAPCEGCGPSCRDYQPESDGLEPLPALAARPVPLPPYQTPTVRHLLYHIYPRWGSKWRTAVNRLRESIGMFNGRKVIAVATDRTTEGPHMVEVALDGTGCEFVRIPNDPERREVATFEPLFGQIADLTGPEHCTLYAQAKGTTRRPGATAHRWAAVLNDVHLDYWPLVAEQLTQFPVTGAFLKTGECWDPHQTRADWHYSGSWMWFRNDALFGQDWRRIDANFWSGIESYPALHFPTTAAGCLFHQGACRKVDLYDVLYWWGTVDPALKAWEAENASRRKIDWPIPTWEDAK
jgi:hypothetical protein